jgi:hypothetical protein
LVFVAEIQKERCLSATFAKKIHSGS